ncbi:acyl carrier protein [Pseudomonadales bacterium]|nr:acyl carrier protein [Pseudomonadales bacterium]MDA8789748.1 acyl carrier protein [Pseudomonadales bacterium]MDA8965718.1 acyl carrier protein [Pseudomonadales bacterium]MDB4363052.1 acyl carrier protein [Pseudomonadales bacterium]MDB4542066.1 acyl carrier protein [Pseudomonadales bacterium]
MENKRSVLRKFILENYLYTEDESALKDDDSFLDSGILDSMGILEVIDLLNEVFSIEVEDDEMIPDNLDSINDLLAFIKKKSLAK